MSFFGSKWNQYILKISCVKRLNERLVKYTRDVFNQTIVFKFLLDIPLREGETSLWID